MALLPIRMYPDPVLREQCTPVTVFDDALRRLVADMVQTMYAAPGVGLAAPQVGDRRRLAIVDVSVGENEQDLHVLINPRIVDQSGGEIDAEACLSIPGLTEKVRRPTRVRLVAQALDGAAFELEASDFFARAICHELDHLDGVLFVDHLRGLRKDRARRHLKRLERSQAETPTTEVLS